MIRRPPRSTLSSSSAASDVYKRQAKDEADVDVTVLGSVASVKDAVLAVDKKDVKDAVVAVRKILKGTWSLPTVRRHLQRRARKLRALICVVSNVW